MKRSTNFKALYKFTKKQKLKDSTSTKDLDDSLDPAEITSQQRLPSSDKKLHQRTQSCPSITETNPLIKTPNQKAQKTQRSQINCGNHSYGAKNKLSHRYCHSQASLQSSDNAQKSISIQNLSTVLYRKSNKEGGLKKSGGGVSGRGKQLFLNNEQYGKARLQQQMKTYQLSEQLRQLQKKSTGINIKQQILQNLLQKFEYQFLLPGNEVVLQ